MKNLTEGEKMVWAAVFAAETKDNAGIATAIVRAYVQVHALRELHFANENFPVSAQALKTAKEVLK